MKGSPMHREVLDRAHDVLATEDVASLVSRTVGPALLPADDRDAGECVGYKPNPVLERAVVVVAP
jgi:hypothetical protein